MGKKVNQWLQFFKKRGSSLYIASLCMITLCFCSNAHADNDRLSMLTKNIKMVNGTVYSVMFLNSIDGYNSSLDQYYKNGQPATGYDTNTGCYYTNGSYAFAVPCPYGGYSGTLKDSGIFFPTWPPYSYSPTGANLGSFSNGIFFGNDGRPFSGSVGAAWNDGSDSPDQVYSFINGQLANNVNTYAGDGIFGNKYYSNFTEYTPANPLGYDTLTGVYFISNNATQLPNSGNGFDSISGKIYKDGSLYDSTTIPGGTGWDNSVGVYYSNGKAVPYVDPTGSGYDNLGNIYYNGKIICDPNGTVNMANVTYVTRDGDPTTLPLSGTGWDYYSGQYFVKGQPLYNYMPWGGWSGTGLKTIINTTPQVDVYFVGGYATTLPANGTGYDYGDWKSYFINGQGANGLDTTGTGYTAGNFYTYGYGGKSPVSAGYYINGVKTTLDQTGSGTWNGVTYKNGARN
jgi:hypothetical protein